MGNRNNNSIVHNNEGVDKLRPLTVNFVIIALTVVVLLLLAFA
jgi:hypothetical protein